MKAVRVALLVALIATVQTVALVSPAAAATQQWKPIQAPGPTHDSTGYRLNAVDCWSAGNCVAVGYYSANGTTSSFIDKETSGKWSYVPVTSSGLDLTAVSCPAAGACVAVGTVGLYSSMPEGALEVQSGNTWTEITATGAEGRYSSYTGSLTGVACPATGNCSAVGTAQSTQEVGTGFILTLRPGNDRTKPSSWNAKKAPESANEVEFENAGLSGISCVSAGNCRAVGYAHHDSNPADDVPLIDEEKNYGWEFGGSPLPSGGANANDGELRSVSCIKGGTVCMAGGTYNGNQQPFIVTIDTDTDSSEAAPEGLSAPYQFGELLASSCAPDGQCQSVGETYANSGKNYGYDGFIVSERYGGKAGTPSGTKSATRSPKDANTIEHNETLNSTSCVSGGFCVSVGSYLNNSGQQGENEASVIDTRTYDSSGAITGETDIQAPEPANDNPTDDDQNILYGVRCNDRTHCVAVGAYYNDTVTPRGVIDTLGSTPAPPKPAVTKISATHGPAAGGKTVTVTGTGLTGATAVKFGSTAGSHLHVVSATKLTVTAPKHAAGRIDVRVTTKGGTSAVTKADRYTYVARPEVTKISPASGSHKGGTAVVVTGKNLTGATAVHFGATSGTHVKAVSSTKLDVTAPAHARGKVDVEVTTAGGTSPAVDADHFRYS